MTNKIGPPPPILPIRKPICDKIVASNYSILTVLSEKAADPRTIMAEFLKFRRLTEQDFAGEVDYIIAKLRTKDLKRMHKSIIANPEIVASIKIMHDLIAYDGTLNADSSFAAELSNVHMDLITFRLCLEKKLQQQAISFKTVAPQIDDEKLWRTLSSLKSARADFSEKPVKATIVTRLFLSAASPARPKTRAPEAKPSRRKAETPEVDSTPVMVQFERDGTLHPELKVHLRRAIGRTNTDKHAPDTIATEVVSALRSMGAELRRKLLDDLYDAINDGEDGELLAVIDRIKQQASDSKPLGEIPDLATVFTVRQAAYCTHDIALHHLKDIPDDQLRTETTRRLTQSTTRAAATDFLRAADQANLRARSRSVRDGIRDIANDGYSDSLAELMAHPLYDPAHVLVLRAAARDGFTRYCWIDPDSLESLFTEAGKTHGWHRYLPQDAKKAIEQLAALPAAVADRLLTRLLQALGDEAAGWKSDTVAKLLEEIAGVAKQPPPFAGWKDIARATTPLEALFVIHDIYRTTPRFAQPERSRMWCAKQLREAGISPADASLFLKHAERLPIAGASGDIREVIRSFASRTDDRSYQLAMILDHFDRFGFGKPDELKSMIEDAFKQSNHPYPSEHMETMLKLPARECRSQLDWLLTQLSEESDGPTPDRRVSGALEAINKEAGREQIFRRWKHLKWVQSFDQALDVIHDIARRPGAFVGMKFGMVAMMLRNQGVTKDSASNFTKFAAALPLEGRSAQVRDLIAAFASEAPIPAGKIFLS